MNRVSLFILFCAALLCSTTVSFCQDFPTINYTVKDGLPSNKVYEIYRDSKGFLWFGTDKGIARYNGLKFEVFTTFNGIPDNDVFFFQEDKFGRLWLGTYNGGLCYYQNDTFHNASNTPFLNINIKSAFIKNVFLLKDSSVIINFTNNKDFVRITRNQSKTYMIDEMHPRTYFLGAEIVNDTTIKIRQTASSVWVNTVTGKITSEKKEQFFCRLFVQNKEYFFDDSAIYDSSYHLISTIKKTKLDYINLIRIYTADGNLYLSTKKSILINDSIEIFKGNYFSCITQDNKENYWMSTLNNGVYVMKHRFFQTKYYPAAFNNVVKYARMLGDDILFTTNTDLYRLRQDTVNKLINFKDYAAPGHSFSEDALFSIDSAHRLFYFNNNEFVFFNNILAQKLKINYYSYGDLGLKSIITAGYDIYVRSINYLQKISYSEQTGMATQKSYNQLKPERIFSMAMSPDKEIWYSTVSDMYKIKNDSPALLSDFKNYVFKHFRFIDNFLLGYTHGNQLLFCRDYKNNLVFDTIASANCLWDKFYKLDSNHILISTNRLYRVLTINPPGSNPGISVSVIEDPFIPLQVDVICTDKNNCYFFKNGAITSIGINNFFVKNSPPEIYLKTLRTRQKTYPIQQDMEISYNEAKAISISFSTLSFNGADVFYQYSITKSGDDNWRDFTGEINLAQPEYGNYTIKIRARTNSSEYSTPVFFNLTILRPFWATWWFITVVSCIIITAITLATRYRITALLRKKEKEHLGKVRFMRSEYKALNALMNPHFIFNTLNNVQDLINKNDKLAANEYLRIFADLIRQNMHNVSMGLISVQKEIDLIKNYLLLEKLRFEDKLNYQIDIDDELDLTEILIPPLLIQPLVENSIKHGILHLNSSDGFIFITVYESDNTLYIEIKDNGVGMNHAKTHAKNHESFGLNNIKKRIEQLSIIQNKQLSFGISEIKDENGVLLWTVATVSLPLS